MPKQINCGVCAFNGVTTAMQLKLNTYFECPECSARLYDNEDGDDTFVRYWQQQQQHISRSLPEGVKIHGGEKKQGKAPGLSRMSKKPINEINLGLYK